MGAIEIGTTASAEPRTPATISPTRGQSELLTTEPASVQRPNRGQPTSIQPTPYTVNKLNQSVQNIRVKPQPTATDSIIPANAIPSEIVLPGRQTSVNPIDFFQAPPLDSGVKLTIGRD
jgi:hypothetical protein